jgi:hypothetical protein
MDAQSASFRREPASLPPTRVDTLGPMGFIPPFSQRQKYHDHQGVPECVHHQ